MDEKLIKLMVGVQMKWNGFWDDLKNEETGAAEIVAIIAIIVVVLAVAVIFRQHLQAVVENVFKKTDIFIQTNGEG